MIKNVIFDIGGVLTNLTFRKKLKSFGYSEEITARLARASCMNPVWRELDRGVMRFDEIVRIMVYTDPEIEDEIRLFMSDVRGVVERADHAIPWIKELKAKGYNCYFLSNWSTSLMKNCTDVMDFLPYLDGGVFSCDAKLLKPDREIYDFIAEKYNLVKSECIFIDDNLDNMQGAKDAGMESLLYTGYDETHDKLNEILGI